MTLTFVIQGFVCVLLSTIGVCIIISAFLLLRVAPSPFKEPLPFLGFTIVVCWLLLLSLVCFFPALSIIDPNILQR